MAPSQRRCGAIHACTVHHTNTVPTGRVYSIAVSTLESVIARKAPISSTVCTGRSQAAVSFLAWVSHEPFVLVCGVRGCAPASHTRVQNKLCYDIIANIYTTVKKFRSAESLLYLFKSLHCMVGTCRWVGRVSSLRSLGLRSILWRKACVMFKLISELQSSLAPRAPCISRCMLQGSSLGAGAGAARAIHR